MDFSNLSEAEIAEAIKARLAELDDLLAYSAQEQEMFDEIDREYFG